jgi:hydrogenase maturation protein HypF
MGLKLRRYRLHVRGRVQGVGFRPTLHRIAVERGWSGWVLNDNYGVVAEVEGSQLDIEAALDLLKSALPSAARIEDCRIERITPEQSTGFTIRTSQGGHASHSGLTPLIPDQAVCNRCLQDVFDPDNRRYRYPFTTCSECGPRYSIARALPFDRETTSMAEFPMCPECSKEYDSPDDRRFHAQTIACPQCGPRLTLCARDGVAIARGDEALLEAVVHLKQGKVVAVKGIGGFHLMVDATNESAVAILRERKRREAKPFAIMVPGLAMAEYLGDLSSVERELFLGAESPIVLARSSGNGLAANVAPGLPLVGLMRAYTPLHHLLLREFQRPLVATSGNLTDEPICHRDAQAFVQLGSIADLFLIHNREIVVGLEDSIVREMAGRGTVFRLGRGLCPATVEWPLSLEIPSRTVMAFGGHIKSSLALAPSGSKLIHLGPHLGSLETPDARSRYGEELRRFPGFHGVEVKAAVCDRHPDYFSTREAEHSRLPLARVQHHVAHVLSCLLDNRERGPVLGVAWDGNGYGGDGTLWGGEFLSVSAGGEWRRLGYLRPFRLPGGGRAVREPRRAALGLLYEIYGASLFDEPPEVLAELFNPEELAILRQSLAKGLNAPVCSSAGRLFDGVAALLGVSPISQFEGQAAMRLEGLAARKPPDGEFARIKIVKAGKTLVFDWEPLVKDILARRTRGDGLESLAAGFHMSLAYGILDMAELISIPKAALTGGVFQNRVLIEATVNLLREHAMTPLWHRNIPASDGGLAAGQILGLEIKCV